MYNKFMKLSGLTLETVYFEDYLSFLTEVLELDLHELTDISMRLDLQGTWLEIKKVPSAPHQVASNVEFSLSAEEFEDLKHKFSFFYYRKGPSRFLFLGEEEEKCEVVDPDGRIWRFKNTDPRAILVPLTNNQFAVRNY
jgi:hypothetical protein